MDDVFVHGQAEVTANGAGGGVRGVGGTHELAHGGDRVLAAHNHLHDRAARDIGNEAIVEGLALMLGVVRLGELLGHHAELHALDGEAHALEAVHYLADVPVANAIRLDHGVGLLDHLASFLSLLPPIVLGGLLTFFYCSLGK